MSLALLAGCAMPPHQETLSEQWQRQDRETEQGAQQRSKDIETQKDKERADYLAEHPDLKPEIRDAISNHKVIIGMTEDQALKSLGGGLDFHSVETSLGKSDSWRYQDMHLVFVNGILTEMYQ